MIKFQKFADKGKTVPTEKPKLIFARICYARNAKVARRRARGLIFSAFHRNWNFMGVHVNSVNSVSSVDSADTSSL